ncbi:MAG: C-GCAxxG-C-C family (seleno)protein [Dehalococcoidales bacterium]
MIKLKESNENIIKKAEELGIEYEAIYKGCAQCTFLAIIDALRWGGLELIPADMEERLYPAISTLTAGVCMTGEGTCGAIASGVMALGLALGVSKDNPDVATARHIAVIIRDTLLDKCYLEYRSILCKDVQRKYFGKAWDLTSDEMAHEFLGITRGCIIIETAKLAVKCILDEHKKEKIKITG